ncbi:MAG: COX aromatic rich motif-containing protein [Sphingomonadaceae bacterium]
MTRARGATILLGAASLLSLSGCAQWPAQGLFAAAGPAADLQRQQFLIVTALVALVIVPLFIGLPWVLWRYRLRGGRGDYRPDWDFSRTMEFLIWGIPVVIVAVLGVVLWHSTHKADPYRPLAASDQPPIVVQAVALDWKWLFIYPDQGVASVGQLVVPAGREVALSITADGPMASLIVPRLGGQIYAMAGMTTQLHLLTNRNGDYRGMNTQYTGTGFDQQHFTYRAVGPAQFSAWIARARSGPALDAARYDQLAKPSKLAKPMLFGAPAPHLFELIIAKYHAEGDTLASLPPPGVMTTAKGMGAH